jgi:hypothetical protein
MAYDPINQLTIAELDTCSRLLKTDIVAAIHGGTMNRWAGMAIVAYVIAKRTDPAAQLGAFRAMTPVELTVALGYPDDDDQPVEPADPVETEVEPLSGWVDMDEPDDGDRLTSPGSPAAPADAFEPIRAAIAVDPTAPTRA